MHTPGPWKHIRQRATDDSHDVMAPGETGAICVATCGHQGCDNGVIAANARFIVRACNAHDELLEACMNAQGAYEALKLLGAHTHLPGYESCINKLNTAIAKATGQI